jgi:hypothetical protein
VFALLAGLVQTASALEVLTLDTLAAGSYVGDAYRGQGAVFAPGAEVRAYADLPHTYQKSSPNCFAIFESPYQVDFVLPGTTTAAVTDSVSIWVHDHAVGTTLGVLEAYDPLGQRIYRQTLTTPGSLTGILAVSRPGTASVRFYADADGAIFDDVTFSAPVAGPVDLRQLTFDDLPVGSYADDAYRDLGAVFGAGSEVKAYADLPHTYEKSPPNVMNVRGDPHRIDFVVPGQHVAGVTDFVSVWMHDTNVGTTLGVLEAYDAQGQLIGMDTLNTPPSQTGQLIVSSPGIAYVLLYADADGSQFDDITFAAPVPEPVTVGMLVVGSAVLLRRRRPRGHTTERNRSMSINRALIVWSLAGALLFVVAGRASAQNLLLNGDFEAGNTGFSSEFVYSPGDIFPAGVYDVLQDPADAHDNCISYKDHSGNGLMFAANGSAQPDDIAWSQSVSVQSNTLYRLEFWLSSWSVRHFPCEVLDVEINGQKVMADLSVPDVSGIWQHQSVEWFSGGTTTASIEFVNISTEPSSYDFALDDMSFEVVPEPATLGMLAGGAVALLRRKRSNAVTLRKEQS